MDRRLAAYLALFLILCLLVASLLAAPAPADAQGAGLAHQVERLSAQVTGLRDRLARTRRTLRRQALRLSRLSLESPDGRFGFGVTNEGLRLRGPGASLTVGSTALTLSGGAGSLLQLAPARTTLTSPQVFFGAGSNCPPVARRGDSVQLTLLGEAARGTITGSSTGVFAC